MVRPAPRSLWICLWLTLASLFIAALVPGAWWVIAGGWLVLALAMVVDAARAIPGAGLWLTIDAPPVLYIGEDDPLVLTFASESHHAKTTASPSCQIQTRARIVFCVRLPTAPPAVAPSKPPRDQSGARMPPCQNQRLPRLPNSKPRANRILRALAQRPPPAVAPSTPPRDQSGAQARVFRGAIL